MQSFIFLSRYAGMREDIVQAGGGNSSVKISPNRMLIKASGFQLSELSEKTGFCEVNPQVISDFFSSDYEITSETEKKLLNDSLLPPPVQNNSTNTSFRPSIETFLHSITQKYTLHTHPTVVNMLCATESGWNALKSLFPDALFVGYATPGIRLASAYFSAFKEFGKIPEIIFLKNHGLLVTGGTGDFVKDKTESVLRTIERHLNLDMEQYHAVTEIYDVTRRIPELKDKIVYLSRHGDITEGISTFGSNLWKWQFCPDCIVYCGKRALVLGGTFTGADFANHLARFGIPTVISYKKNVYILADSIKKAHDIESVLAFSAQVALANKDGELNVLSEDEQNFLLNWDAEKYRQRMK